jgi:hypothetical protein
MHVIRQTFCLSHGYIILIRNGSENGNYLFFGLGVGPDVFSILCTPGKVIPEIIPGVAGMFDAHLDSILTLCHFPNHRFILPL